jgi:hypothetical protein
MQQCSIYDKSLKFSRFIYAIVVLIAFLIQNKWLVLAVSFLTIIGAFSLSLNFPYQLHILTEKYLMKKNAVQPSIKDFGEISFVSAITGILLLIGFLLLQFTKYTSFAWIYILIVTAMIFMACLVGFCVATMMYIVIRNKFSTHKQD